MNFHAGIQGRQTRKRGIPQIVGTHGGRPHQHDFVSKRSIRQLTRSAHH
jgi:hypothetical protein